LLRQEVAGEETGQDQHALGMQRAAQLDLALDVDDLAGAEADAGGDAHRAPESEVGKVDHRQAVHAAHGGAVRVHQQRAVEHRLQRALAQAVEAPLARGDGRVHVLARGRSRRRPRARGSRFRA
jgi:hypothetical protein